MHKRDLEFAKPTFGQRVRSLVCTCAFSLLMSLWGMLLTISVIPYHWLFRHKTRFRSLDSMFSVCDWLSRRLFNIDWKLINGQLPSEPCIVLCKHQSTWDALVINRLLRCTIVGKKELAYIPWWGQGFAMSGAILINRSTPAAARKSMTEKGKQALDDGISILLFPEGTRSEPGIPGNYRTGGAMIAEYAGVPIVPVALDSGYYWPRRSWIKYRGTIRVAIGEPIPPSKDWRAATKQASDWIEDELAGWELPAHIRDKGGAAS